VAVSASGASEEVADWRHLQAKGTFHDADSRQIGDDHFRNDLWFVDYLRDQQGTTTDTDAYDGRMHFDPSCESHQTVCGSSPGRLNVTKEG
jgi:hypothetical protein